jgi:Glycosyl hydrolase family 45/ShK domain-like
MQMSFPSLWSSCRRPFLSASFLVAAGATVFATDGCSSQPAKSDSSAGVSPFSGVGSGAAGAGGLAASGGAASTSGPVTGGEPTAGSSSTSAAEGSIAVGGLDNGTATGSGASEPCVDVEPPPDPEWPDATCATWAVETEECSAAWFQSYCDLSCGRCVPESSGGAVAAPEPCEDTPAPFDPEWPEATCESWAFEAAACGEDWFQNYCDVSCGRCIPDDGSGPPMPPDCSGENLPNVSGGAGFATRYWDCCQPACAQNGGHKCSQDGVTQTGDNSSACVGGGAFACYDDAPRAISNCLSYGHVAKANPNCGGCFRIQFTGTGNSNANDIGSKLIQGKQMIVKVTNTGSDVAGNQFDLMIPGGGVGLFNACSRQWNTDDLGAQYGGFLSACTTGTHAEKKECVRQRCMNIPAGSARDGCLWFVDWFEIADNPNFTSEATNCPF